MFATCVPSNDVSEVLLCILHSLKQKFGLPMNPPEDNDHPTWAFLNLPDAIVPTLCIELQLAHLRCTRISSHKETQWTLLYLPGRQQLVFNQGSTGKGVWGVTSSWNHKVRRHATWRAALPAQWRMTNLMSSDRALSVFYTVFIAARGEGVRLRPH